MCLNWGCIPTKALLKSAEVYAQLGHLKDYGLSAGAPTFDFPAVIARSRAVAKQLNQGVAFLMKKNKIEVIEGVATLEKGSAAPRGSWSLPPRAATKRTLQAKAVILATGARAKEIPAIGLKSDGDRVWTYRDAMTPKAMPKSLLIVGSGAIGVEFGSFYASAGRQGDRGRGPATHPPRRGRGDLHRRPQGLREAGPERSGSGPRSRSSSEAGRA